MYSSWSVAAAVCSCVFPTWAIVAVGLRFYSRHMKSIKIGADDWLVLAALIFAIGYCFAVLEGSFHGSIGQDLSTITAVQYTRIQKFLLAGVIISHLAFGFVKLGVLFFYKRIFSVPRFYLIANIISVVVIMFMVALTFTQVFASWPVSNWWKLGMGYTIDYGSALTAFSAIDLALDIIILCLPVPIIRKMSMKRSKKMLVLGIFWMGFFCVIATAVRVYFTYRLSQFHKNNPGQSISDETYSYVVVNNILWAEIESCCSVIAACLPTYAPFLRNIPVSKPWASLYRVPRRFKMPKVKNQAATSHEEGLSNLWYPLGHSDRRIETVVDGSSNSDGVLALDQLQGIRIERNFITNVDSQ